MQLNTTKMMNKIMFAVFVCAIIWQMPALAASERPPDFLGIETSPPYFTDVQEGHAHYLAINFLYEKGIIDGYADGTYKSENSVNRAEALKMILLAFNIEIEDTGGRIQDTGETEEVTETEIFFKDLENGEITEVAAPVIPLEAITPTGFSDVDETVWFKPFVDTAVKNKLINGYPDGSFGASRPITLVEALKINLEADKALLPIEVPDEIFVDTHATDWFSAYVLYAKDLSILNIAPANTITPHQELSRGKLAELIYRIHKSKNGHKFGIASYYGDMFHGRRTASGETLDNNAMTAASRTLAFGTVVRVTNPRNGQTVDVTITDRGPYVYGRVLDLTKGAFTKIFHPGAGIARVEYRIITQEELDAEQEALAKEKEAMIIESFLPKK